MESDAINAAAATELPREHGQVALDCYLRTLLAIGRYAAEVCPHIGSPFNDGLLQLHERLASSSDAGELEQSVEALESELAGFAKRTAEYYTHKTGDIADILEVVTNSVETFEARDLRYLERLSQLSRGLAAGIAAAGTPEAIKAACERQADQLKAFAEQLQKDSRAVFEDLRDNLAEIENRLIQSEAEASIDPLTALANRHEMERIIRGRAAAGKVFCLLLFDIRHLGEINERFGREAGDQLLQQFGARLSAQVRPRDIVSRWGDDEFATVFDCDAREAAPRADQIRQSVAGRYTLTVDGQDWKPEVEGRLAILEHRHGESPEDFIARAASRLEVGAPAAQRDPEPAGTNPFLQEFAVANWRMA